MERKSSQNPSFTASKPPAGTEGRRVISAANHHQNPMMTHSYQSIESAFSRLDISSGVRLPSHATSSSSRLAAIDDGFTASLIPPTMASGRRSEQALIWAHSQMRNASIISGPGSHQRIDMGPAIVERGPYLHAGDHNQLMMHNQRQDFLDANSNDFGRCTLHGKEPSYNVPTVPFAWENNSWNFSYTDQQLYTPQQHLVSEGMRGGIASLATSPVFSEFLILKLEVLSENEIDMILLELMGCWGDLLKNQFGSRFVQKLFSVCSEDQKTWVIIALVKLRVNLVTICLNPFGARAIQKLMEKLNTPQQISLMVASLARGALALATDPNGQNVVQFCVKRFPREYTKHLLYEIAKNCYRIATSKAGCCVLPACIDNSRGEAREQLISAIIANALHLAEDQYGNYVVQHLLTLNIQEVAELLLQRFQGYFLHLSCNKFASNVVEKVLESSEKCCKTIVMELLRSPTASMLLLDPFGNFVIQRALSASKGEPFKMLVNLISANMQSMQSNLYGKKILAWFEKRKLYIACKMV